MRGRGTNVGRLVETALRVTDSAENLAVVNRLAAQAVGDRLQEGIAIADMQRAGGAENLSQLSVGKMENGHCGEPQSVAENAP